jgi:hypothetical protein
MRRLSLVALFAWLCTAGIAMASEYHGQITFGDLPLPGALITATQGTAKFTAVSDQGGMYKFPDLADGTWTIKIEMQCFAPVQSEISIAAATTPGKWQLALLPIDQLVAIAKTAITPFPTPPVPQAQIKPDSKQPVTAAVEAPKPSEDAQASDGLLVNGSVNNAATSQFSLDRAFGNRRANSRNLYNGGLAVILGDSTLNARAYSLSGVQAPRPDYNLITAGFTIGGPLRIPRLLTHNPPTFFAGYQTTRNRDEADETGLVPTSAQREGDLSGLTNSQGQPITILNPLTGRPFTDNIVPVSSQAQALLALYPLPNITNNALYNYQVPVLDDSHQDVTQARLERSFGRRDDVYGTFNLQSVREGNVNLFGFVDSTDTLGIDSKINWSHRLSPHVLLKAGYEFSRLRTLIRPEFQDREDISANAGINGNDREAADWGPPALNFSSGIIGLSDGNSAFNRDRTDAFSFSASLYRGRHNISAGGDLRKQQYNDLYQQNPRGIFNFTGAATQGTSTASTPTGSDLADFLIGVPDTSSIAYGNADKYFRQAVYDLYAQDDLRLLSNLTVKFGGRWEYGAPMTELKGRLVNLDVARNFATAAPVLGSDPVGSVTGQHYPGSLIRPDRSGFQPAIALSWRPIPASTVVVRAGYGLYHDTSVYLGPAQQLAQQAPLSTSLSVANSPACPLTLANGFGPCASVNPDTYAVDPDFRVGYAQIWTLSMQRDLPFALQMTATYLGTKGTHGVQEFLPNTYPIGAADPCPACPIGFEYRTSGGNSIRESGLLELRRRLRAGFTATLRYTYSKSVDDDAMLGGQGPATTSSQAQGNSESTSTTTPSGPSSISTSIAQNWLDLRAERGLSAFDQRHLLNVQLQYTTGQGLEGGTLMRGWPARLLKEWTVLTKITTGTGLPESPSYLAAVPGTGFSNTIRPSLTGAPIHSSTPGVHVNLAAYAAPAPGHWGDAGRNSITGPGQFSLDTSLERTFRATQKYNLTARIDATNLLNHAVFTNWVTAINSTQFGVPASVNSMRSLQITIRLRF